MKKEKRDYNLNLDLLVPFFLIGHEKIKNEVWFKANEEKEEYKQTAKECYGSISTILEDNEQIVRWENENWNCELFNKEISFILEKKKGAEWPEVQIILRIYLSKWNVNYDSFEKQIKKLLETYFKEKIISLPERQIKFKLGFHGKNEQNKPDILISLIDKSGKTKKEDKIALEITEIDTSPLSVKEDKGSTHRVFDGEMKKRNFDKAREAKKELEIIKADSYLSNLLANMGNMLLKKNKKNYDCGKTIIWVNLLAYCHVDIEDLTIGKNFCLAYKSREIDEKFFSHFLLKKIKEISEEFKDKGKKMNFDYLIIKFAEADQETMHEGKLYKFVFFVKEILNIPIVSGEIMVEEELKKINDEYKDKLDKLRISPCRVVSNWETRKLLMDDEEKKYYENREKK